VRARTVLYAAIIGAVAIMLYALATRSSEGISVIHDRNPMFVRLSSGDCATPSLSASSTNHWRHAISCSRSTA
jgi:polyferredoxin